MFVIKIKVLILHTKTLKTMEGRRQIWVRLGVLVCGEAQQIERVINGDANTLETLVKECKFFIDGNSYIPESSIEEYNQDYGTDHKVEDVEFDL